MTPPPRCVPLFLLTATLLGLCDASAQSDNLHRFWPRFPRPKTLLVVPFVGNHEEGMTFVTAAGLAADALRRGKGDLMVLEDVVGNTGYERWTRGMMDLVKPRATRPTDTWGVVAELRKRGLAKGYILFRYDDSDRLWHSTQGSIDESANVATALAAQLGGVAVSERFEAKAKELGLPLLMDARDKTEAWCLEHYGDQFSRTVLMTADPKSRVAREMGVAMRAFVVSKPGPTYEAALARCEPDCPVLGWGCGGEDEQTMASSKWGLFQTATNWCHNLPAYCTEEVGGTIPVESVRARRAGLTLADLEWESGVHYATFLMSDGDNVQWLMGNFAGGSEGRWYYESPARGKFPFGRTLCAVDLAQLCPYVLQDLFRRAAPTDDFVLYGGGYYYPDHFGEKRGTAGPTGLPGLWGDVMSLHASRLAGYMKALGIRAFAINAMDWDGPQAVAAYGKLAANIPTLEGILTVQYYPYSGGEGRILWVGESGRERPVVSAAYCIWAQTGRPRDATPAGVAARLNAAPVGGETWADANFSFVMPHSWSRFKDTQGDPSLTAEEDGVDQSRDAAGTARGLLPVQWCVDRLGPQVRVVTPTELLLQVRLHLRTRQTLTAWLEELRARATSSRARQLLAAAEGALAEVKDGDDSGRRCFQLLKRAERLTRNVALTPRRPDSMVTPRMSLAGGPVRDVQIVEKPAITLAGVEFNPELHGWQFVPTLLYRLCSMLPRIRNQVAPGTLYGFAFARHRTDPGVDTYLAGVEVPAAADLAEGVVTATIPGGAYAVFTVKGGLGDIGAAYEYINKTWLPQSGYREARCGAVEVYDQRFVPGGTSEFEIWMAVEPSGR